MIKRPPKLQKYIYFAVQKLRKEPVKKAWEQIMKTDYTDKKALENRILKRGKEHFYYLFQHIPKLQNMPNKNTLLSLLDRINTIAEFDDFLKHIPPTQKHDVIERPEILTSDEIKKIHVFGTHSSGTTGQSVRFPKDMRDWAQTHANMFYILKLHGIDPFAPYIYYWAGDWSIKSRITYFLKDVALNRLRLTSYNTSKEHLFKQYKLISKFKPEYILGIPSGIATLATFMVNEKLTLQNDLKAVFTTGETLHKFQKDIIYRAFKTPVINLYGSAEVGVIGFECPKSHMHIMMDTNYIEIMDSGEILVTNLFQKAFAIVRYRIGDLSSSTLQWEHDCEISFPIIRGIEGRTSQKIVLPDGRELPPMAPTYIFDKVAHTRSVIKFRYVLRNSKLLLLLVVNHKFNERVKNLIIKESFKIFGIKPEIVIVDTIPPLPGGKEKYFIIESNGKEH